MAHRDHDRICLESIKSDITMYHQPQQADVQLGFKPKVNCYKASAKKFV